MLCLAGTLDFLGFSRGGLLQQPAGGGNEAIAIEALVDSRLAALASKDFAKADTIRADLAAHGFTLADTLFFFFLPLPRPLDKFFPTVSTSVGARMERLGRSRLGVVGEGFLTLSRKPVSATHG